MRYYRTIYDGSTRLVVADDTGTYDLTSANEQLSSFSDLAEIASVAERGVDELAASLSENARSLDEDEVSSNALRPVVPDEVWAAGMTYEISRDAREGEQAMPDLYLAAYEAERPVLFHKATENRTVGPGEDVGIRSDSDWDVPEPELGIVLYDGEIVGYTLGNDMSSRSIEGGNAMHQQQAKVFARCCSIGPSIISSESIGDPHDLEMTMEIYRDGEKEFEGKTSTNKMVRKCEELVDYYNRNNDIPRVSVLLTGTSLVPPDEFTLQSGDEIRMSLEEVGILENSVVEV